MTPQPVIHIVGGIERKRMMASISTKTYDKRNRPLKNKGGERETDCSIERERKERGRDKQRESQLRQLRLKPRKFEAYRLRFPMPNKALLCRNLVRVCAYALLSSTFRRIRSTRHSTRNPLRRRSNSIGQLVARRGIRCPSSACTLPVVEAELADIA